MELSKRLQAVANLVSQGMCVADVGTDHGYIPIYLVESQKAGKVIAMDINQGPLARAREHIVAHGLENQIETRRSDGVQALQVGECDCVIIAGMGGSLAIKIMEEGKDVFSSLKEFVLQPQSEIEKVRRYLIEEGYRCIAEDMILEDGKYYPMMKVISGQSDTYDLKELCYGKLLLEQKHPVLKGFLEKERNNREKILQRLGQGEAEHIQMRRQEIEQEMLVIRQALQVYGA